MTATMTPTRQWLSLGELRARLRDERAAFNREQERCLAREISILHLERRRGMVDMLELLVHDLERGL